ncbi:MAG: GDSL-type esterase/lipase family protein [Eubacterium sp.]|nr:GDSL-type esterase/lipase family protein [Eubacterium sp.]
MKKYYFYGDSNTYGYDPRDPFGGCYPENKIWTNILQKLLGDSTAVIADGLNGRKIPNHKRTIELLEMSLQREEPLAAFAVMLGSNDLLLCDSRDGDVNTDEIVKTMEDFLLEIRNFLDHNPEKQVDSGQGRADSEQRKAGLCQGKAYVTEEHPKILLIAPPPLHYQKNLDSKISEIRTGYQKIAARHGWDYIDTGAWNLPLAFDGVHLSEEGHRIFAEKMAEWLKRKNQPK